MASIPIEADNLVQIPRSNNCFYQSVGYFLAGLPEKEGTARTARTAHLGRRAGILANEDSCEDIRSLGLGLCP